MSVTFQQGRNVQVVNDPEILCNSSDQDRRHRPPWRRRHQGGIETYCSSFYKRLSPSKYDVTIFVSRPAAGPEWNSGSERSGFRHPGWRVGNGRSIRRFGVVLSGLLGIRTIHVQWVDCLRAFTAGATARYDDHCPHLGAEYTRTKWSPLGRLTLPMVREIRCSLCRRNRLSEPACCGTIHSGDRPQ